MSAIPLTVILSLALAGLFTLLFWREHRRRDLGGAERDSLLPLADETPRTVCGEPAGRMGLSAAPAELFSHMRQKFLTGPAAADHGHEDHHAHSGAAAKGRCGCRDGLRPPCAGCRGREAATL